MTTLKQEEEEEGKRRKNCRSKKRFPFLSCDIPSLRRFTNPSIHNTQHNKQKSIALSHLEAKPPPSLTMATPRIIVGGTPTPPLDDAICVVLLLLFFLSALAHFIVLRTNNNKNNKKNPPSSPPNFKFAFSGMMCALCLLRCLALAVRMAWASSQSSSSGGVATAATALAQLGTVLIYITNIVLAQRVLRGYRPRFGWRRATTLAFNALLAAVVVALVFMVAAGVALGCFYARIDGDGDGGGDDGGSEEEVFARRINGARVVQLLGAVALAILATVPVPVVLGAAVAWGMARSCCRGGGDDCGESYVTPAAAAAAADADVEAGTGRISTGTGGKDEREKRYNRCHHRRCCRVRHANIEKFGSGSWYVSSFRFI